MCPLEGSGDLKHRISVSLVLSGDNPHSSPFPISHRPAFCKLAGSGMFISEYLTSKIIKY